MSPTLISHIKIHILHSKDTHHIYPPLGQHTTNTIFHHYIQHTLIATHHPPSWPAHIASSAGRTAGPSYSHVASPLHVPQQPSHICCSRCSRRWCPPEGCLAAGWHRGLRSLLQWYSVVRYFINASVLGLIVVLGAQYTNQTDHSSDPYKGQVKWAAVNENYYWRKPQCLVHSDMCLTQITLRILGNNLVLLYCCAFVYDSNKGKVQFLADCHI